MYPIIPRKPVLLDPDPPAAVQVERQMEARYWVDLRDTLGELSIFSQLMPETPAPESS